MKVDLTGLTISDKEIKEMTGYRYLIKLEDIDYPYLIDNELFVDFNSEFIIIRPSVVKNSKFSRKVTIGSINKKVYHCFKLASFFSKRLKLKREAIENKIKSQVEIFLKELKANPIGILLDNADSYNLAVQKITNLLDVSDKLVEAGNPRFIKEEDRWQMLATFRQVRADLVRAIKTDRIWRENPNIKPQDFQIPVTPAAARYELSEQAKEYQQMVDEAMKISSIVQEQMEMMRGVTNDKKDSVVEQLSVMRQKSLLCSQLERGSIDAQRIHAVQTAWNKIPALSINELKLKMNTRFASALFC